MTTTTSAWTGAPFGRDLDDEEDTHIYERRAPSPRGSRWDQALVGQIMRELSVAASGVRRTKRTSQPVVVDAAPNPFATPQKPGDPPPPWIVLPTGSRSKKTVVRPRQEGGRPVLPSARTRSFAPHRSAVLWLVFTMSFGIAFGIVRDRALRAELSADAAHAVTSVSHAATSVTALVHHLR
jgi:hypothetical protein